MMGKLIADTPAAGPSANASSKVPTSEQLRIAQLLVDPKSEDHSVMKDKVNKVMELTRCNESTALVALHDCDNDVEQAVDKLLEGDHQGVWIVQEGKKSKKVQQQQHHPHQNHHQQLSKDEFNAAADDENAGRNYENYDDDHSKSFSSAPHYARGSARGGGQAGSDFPPRFRGRGGSGMRGNARRLDKENEPMESGGVDRGRFRGRGRGGRDIGGDRGRGRGGFAPRGGRRGGFAGGEGFNQQIGSWNSEVESNTWDNSMANSCNTKSADGGARRSDEWANANDNNTWDNSMAETAPAVKAKSQRSNEWNNNSADDWGGEEDWSKLRDGLVIEPSGVQKQQNTGPVAAPVSSSTHTAVSSSYAAVSSSGGHVRGESIDVNILFGSQLPENQSSAASQQIWTTKQATADLKNELGIGGNAQPSQVEPAGHGRQRESLPMKQNHIKVELPSYGGGNAIGPIDVQFGDMTLLTDSQSMFTFDAQTAFKPQTTTASQSQDTASMRQGQVGNSGGVYQRTQKAEHINGPDLLMGAGDGGAKAVDINAATYTMSGGYSTAGQQQEQSQFGSTGRQTTTAPGMKTTASGITGLSSTHQRASQQNQTNDSAVQQLSNQGGIPMNMNQSSHMSTTSTTNYGLPSSQQASRSPATVTTRQQATSSLNLNPNYTPYQQAIAAAGLSPYLGMYDQMSLSSVGYLPQNLFLNTGGYDMRTLTQLPPMAGNTITGRDSSGDIKTSYMRQDTGSNLAAAATGLANLSVPPPGLPAPTVSNAEQAAQILSMAGMYQTLPFINAAAPPYLAPQFLVPNVSSSATGVSGNQFQRSGYPQMYGGTGYDDIQLSQDYMKSNYAAMSSANQTKTVSSGAGGLALGGNDANKGYAGGLKGSYDAKSFVPATATPPPLGNMNFPAPFQTTATAGAAYGYPNYMPQVNMNMLASPMAAAMASNVQLSGDLLSAGAMNQRGVNQNSKSVSSNMGKPQGQYPFPSWGN